MSGSRPSSSGLSASGASTSSSPPTLRPRWFYASESSGGWLAFSSKDDEALEKRFQDVGGEEWWLSEEQTEKRAERREERLRHSQVKPKDEQMESGQSDQDETGWLAGVSKWWNSKEGEGSEQSLSSKVKQAEKDQGRDDESDEPVLVEEILDPDESEEERRYKVAVLEDYLFDVDIEVMQLYPAFFKGVLLKTVRATWFYWSELKEEYSPISWESEMALDLEKVWQQTAAWKSGSRDDNTRQSGSSDSQKSPLSKDQPDEEEKRELIEIRTDGKGGKGRVRFNSACEGSVFSEDVRGRLVALVGGATVIRGFDEVERRTAKGSRFDRAMFEMPDLPMPWSDPSSSDGADAEQKKQERLNDSVKSTGKAGAAQPTSHKPPPGGGADGSNTTNSGKESETEDQGFASRLWPSSGSWLRPRFNLLKTLGLGDEGAEQETKRSQKQKNTEAAADQEGKRSSGGESDERAQFAQAEDDGDAQSDDEDEGEKEEDLDDLAKDPVHLILVIHGIGQGIVDSYESLDFTYDVQKLRSTSKERAKDVGIRKLARGRRVQYIPICWRKGLKFEHKSEGNDNHFGLADVTNDATIPFIRNIVSKVILDVPFYLSPIYKDKMVRAVTMELNRVYRLFVRRNPDFLANNGKVSLIAHSLGSALAADILSNQPTEVPPLDSLSSEEIHKIAEERLLFDTSHCFLVGSPLGLFLLLGGGQLIARRTEEKAHIGEDATDDSVGRFGNFALHGNLFNVYNSADPVAYRLNGSVDAHYANLLRPLPLPGAVAAILDSLRQPRLSIAKLFDPERPFASAGKYELGAATSSFFGNKKSQSKSTAAHIKYGETRDNHLDDPHSHKESQRQKQEAERGSDGGGGGDDDDDHDDDADRGSTNNERRGSAKTDSSLPSGVVTPVHLEPGTAAKKQLPQEIIKKAEDDPKVEELLQDSSVSLDALAKAERRFRALNSHGTLDFYYSSSSGPSSSFGEYFSMLSAHNGYWQSESFVSLVLSQVFDVVPASQQKRKGGELDEQSTQEQRRSASPTPSVVTSKATLVPQIGAQRDDDKEHDSKHESS